MTSGQDRAAAEINRPPRVPPRWFVRAAWLVHRTIYRVTLGRFGLWRPRERRWGTLRLTTIGRRSGTRRHVILGYYEDGPNLVTLAMNGWAQPEPAWWLNLQSNPEATAQLAGGSLSVRGRAAEGEERARLWARWQQFGDDVEGYARRRTSQTAVVVLEPLVATAPSSAIPGHATGSVGRREAT